MSFATDFDLKDRVRSSVDIVDLIGQQMEVRRQGRNFVCRCPWHDDRRPSLMINQERQTWRCWVCDIGGDAFSFVMKRDGVSFPEALKLLAEQAGIVIEQTPGQRKAVPGSKDDKATLMAAMRWAVDQYADCFVSAAEGELARKYAAERGFSAESIEKFRIGFAPESWDWLLTRAKKAGFSGDVLHACGLAEQRKSGEGHYDMFRNRILFPIFDLQGRPISLGGRVLPGTEAHGGKYINGRETRLFSKSKQLYGLNWARDAIVREKRALVMEGYTDVLTAVQTGVETAVAVLGTALGAEHVKILRRFAETVVLVLDGDQAGQRRADEVLELFVGADVDLRVLTLPDGLDPAEYLQREGVEAFGKLVETAPDAIDHKLARLTDGVDLTHDTHRSSKALETLLAILSRGPSKSTDLRLRQTLLRLARTFTVPIEMLERRLEELRKAASRYAKPFGKPSVQQGVSQNSEHVSAPVRSHDHDASEAFSGGWIEEAEPEGIWDTSQTSQARVAEVRPATDAIALLDRELFETLIERPDFVAMAVETISEQWLMSDSSRELLRAYQSQELAGLSLDVRDLMLTIENESLKNQLVAMDSRVQEKSGAATQSAEQRFESILRRYQEFEAEAETRDRIAQLDQGSVPEEEQLNVLGELFAAQRLRHGLTGRTDQDS